MKINCTAKDRSRTSCTGFTLPETMVAVAIVGIFLTTFFTCLVMGVNLIRAARENERATQVIVEKFEAMRLYTWDQITNTGYIPTSFAAPFDPVNTNGTLTYSGTVTITNVSNMGTYSNDLKKVKVQLTWTSGNVVVTQSMDSFVAHYGMQNYIY